MPVEIRELQITAIVNEASTSASSSSNNTSVNTDAIVAECVEQVLEILQQKNER